MDCFYPKFNILFVCLNVGLACNEATTNVELNLSNNNLSVHGANVLENCIGTVKCLSRLDLSENNLEAEMAGVMQGLAKNKSLLSLNASKNMTNVKAKYLSSVMESIVGLITSDESSVTKLNLSGKLIFVPFGTEQIFEFCYWEHCFIQKLLISIFFPNVSWYFGFLYFLSKNLGIIIQKLSCKIQNYIPMRILRTPYYLLKPTHPKKP